MLSVTTHISPSKVILLKKVLYICVFVFLLCFLIFSLFYRLSSYESLKNWYLSLNNCFYKQETWANDFFTQAVKIKGNYLSLAGCTISFAGIIYVIYNWRKLKNTSTAISIPGINKQYLAWYAVVFVLAILIGITRLKLTAPAFDEIFSAVNCGRLPAFQIISYYMLPNNHMYFNLINHVFFSWSTDLVQTGRLISFVTYTCVLFCAFYWLYKLIKIRWMAFIALLPIALQFTTWGFSMQARGYECELMCGWVSFISIMEYAQSNNKNALHLNTLFNILGMAFLPTFLYILLAEVLFISCMMVYNRTMKWYYLKHQVICCACTFLLYLPGLCFSGATAFTNNPYVTPTAKDLQSYIPTFIEFSRYMINFCFSMFRGEDHPINFVLFSLPLLLFFSKQKERRSVAIFYILLWIVFAAFTLHIRRQPFIRNMIIHYSLTMAFVVYTFYVITDSLVSYINKATIRYACQGLWVFAIVYFCRFQLITDRQNVSLNLYFNNVNAIYEEHITAVNAIPPGSSISFSNESFYIYYLCHQKGLKANKCTDGTEKFYVKRPFEQIQCNMANEYTLLKKLPADYELYTRK